MGRYRIRNHIGEPILGKYGYVNSKGKEITGFKYDICYGCQYHNGLAGVKKGSKYGFINTKGEEVISVKYTYVWSSFENGIANAEFDNESFYIDKKGNRVEKPEEIKSTENQAYKNPKRRTPKR